MMVYSSVTTCFPISLIRHTPAQPPLTELELVAVVVPVTVLLCPTTKHSHALASCGEENPARSAGASRLRPPILAGTTSVIAEAVPLLLSLALSLGLLQPVSAATTTTTSLAATKVIVGCIIVVLVTVVSAEISVVVCCITSISQAHPPFRIEAFFLLQSSPSLSLPYPRGLNNTPRRRCHYSVEPLPRHRHCIVVRFVGGVYNPLYPKPKRGIWRGFLADTSESSSEVV